MRHFLALALLLASTTAAAQTARVVDGARLRLGDIVVSAPENAFGLDLGPAPAPGASRLLAKDEVMNKLRAQGYDPKKLDIPAAIRVVGASRKLVAHEVARLAEPSARAALPLGVELVSVEGSTDVIVSPQATVRAVELPRLPRRKGQIRTSALVVFAVGAEVVARIPVMLVVDVSEQAARPDVTRGSRVLLAVEHRSIRVTTEGSTLVDGNVGDTVTVRVGTTGRVVQAKIRSRDEADVLEGS